MVRKCVYNAKDENAKVTLKSTDVILGSSPEAHLTRMFLGLWLGLELGLGLGC